MERMHGVDAFMIYNATTTSPFATLKVTIYEPVDPADVPAIEEVRDFVLAQIQRLGAGVMGMRIVRVPFDLHHPVWVRDPDYSPGDHIYRTALPAPGDKAQLCEFLSDMMGRPLDPDRPLWEVWIVEGLVGGRIAVAIKVHHALADGKTIATLLARSHARGSGREREAGGRGDNALPGRFRLMRDALIDLVATYTDELPSFVRERRRVREQVAAITAGEELEPAPPPAPFTVLNQRGGGRYRIYRYETFSLSELKQLSRHFDCTLNTLVLGICSEALKRYLRDVDDLPAESLIGAMPMGDRGGRARRTRLHNEPPHNSVAVAVLPLHTDIEDFAERLRAIKRSSKSAIARVERAEGNRFDNFLEFLPGTAIRWMNALMRRQQAQRKSAYANAVISNVPGPSKPLLALDGRLRMIELLSTGNIHDLGNLNITVWSYVDSMTFSFYMRKAALPEPDKIPAYVREVVEELQKGTLAGDARAVAR